MELGTPLGRETGMISERLRLMLAEERRPLFIRHLVFGLALFPIPMIRTGLAEFSLLLIITPFSQGVGIGIGILFWISLISLPLIPLFLAWSLPGAGRLGLPKRSIGALCLLIAYHPFRFYLDGTLYGPETRAEIAGLHEQFPVVWAFKHLDTPLLLGLVLWAILRSRRARPKEKMWFHWVLFVCALWAAGGFYDFAVGVSLPVDLREPTN